VCIKCVLLLESCLPFGEMLAMRVTGKNKEVSCTDPENFAISS